MKYKNIKEAEIELLGKIGHSTFQNMARTLVKKKSFKSSASIMNKIFYDTYNDFIFKKAKLTKKEDELIDLENEYVKFDDKEWKITIDKDKKTWSATILESDALVTWKYKLVGKNNRTAKIKIWFIVTAPFPLNFLSLNSSVKRIQIMKIFFQIQSNMRSLIKKELENEK